MNKSFKDKVNFLYTVNKKTPLFLRKAFYEISDKNLEKGISILEEGIERYPFFIPAMLLLVRAYAMNRRPADALALLKKADKLFNNKETYNYYLQEISFFNPPAPLPGAPPVDESKNFLEPFGKFFADKQSSSFSLPDDEEYSYDENTPEDENDAVIVSETIAKIYIGQGELQEAIKIYEKLLLKEPEKTGYYTEKINELKSRLDNI